MTADVDFRDLTFELIENDSGHAAGRTRLTFEAATVPYRGTYRGPNVVFGQVIVTGGEMLYHAMDTEGSLSAGRASVAFNRDTETLTLRWQWLTGPGAGTSVWRLVS
ncbi:MAG: hypothetical protein AAF525_02285 [Pseudomonadota bacterium]